MDTIHTRIRDRRKELGLSMEALGEKAGVEWQAVQKWENGKAAPKRTRLTKVATALKTTPEFLLTDFQHTGTSQASTARGKAKVIDLPKSESEDVRQIIELIRTMNEKGHAVLLARARDIAKEYPLVKAKPAV